MRTQLFIALLLTACTGQMQGGGTGGGSGGTGGGTGGGITSPDMPCAVATVLQGTCQSCHGATLQNSAPMHLVTRADLLAASVINSEQTVGQRCVQRMSAATGRMPPEPQNAIPQDQIDAFNVWVVAGMPAQACQPGTGGGSAGTGGGAGGTGGGAVMPFTPDAPAVYGAKVKDILVGLPLTDAELTALNGDASQLSTLVDQWQALPQYQTKMLRFFQLAFQQTQVTANDFRDQLGPVNIGGEPQLVQNLQESFARSVVVQNAIGTPLTDAMKTQTYSMTTAVQLYYALLDVWQVDNDARTVHDAFRSANPGKMITISASSGPIPLADSIDPTKANYMHWYDPNVMAECGMDPVVAPARGDILFQVLVGGRLNMGQLSCTKPFTAQLTASDYTDWRTVTVRPPHGSEKATWYYDLPTLRASTQSVLLLNRPYVGFFTTPAFFANWQTNDSNQMRVTMNQTLIVATGTQVDGTDTTTPSTTPGLDEMHVNQPACQYCHQTLDPTRSIFAATFSWYYGKQLDGTYSAQPGLFAYRGVITPVSTIYDLGTVLSTHPLFADAWVQKLCYYINSQACDESDPELTGLVSTFKTQGYAWDKIVKAVVMSPLTTHAATTLTATNDGVALAVARRDHLCARWNARLQLDDICGLDVTKRSPLSGSARQIVPGLPSDGYSRGSTVPVLSNDPTLFYRAGIENLCAGLAALLIDNANAPAGAKTWQSSNPTPAIADFVSLVAGLPAPDPRAPLLSTLLTQHFNDAKAMSGLTAKAALQSTFMAACMSPSASAVGL